MRKLIVFWLLIVFGVAAIGLAISNFMGDKIYDKTKHMAKSYFEEDIKKEEKEISE